MDLTLMHPLKLHNLWYTLFTENFTFTVSGSSLSQTSEAVCHIFANLNKHNRLYLIFDPTDPVPAIHILNKPDESDFDGEVVEQRPQNVPALVINAFIIFVFVDANHAGNLITQQFWYSYLVHSAPIIWLRECQNTFWTPRD